MKAIQSNLPIWVTATEFSLHDNSFYLIFGQHSLYFCGWFRIVWERRLVTDVARASRRHVCRPARVTRDTNFSNYPWNVWKHVRCCRHVVVRLYSFHSLWFNLFNFNAALIFSSFGHGLKFIDLNGSRSDAWLRWSSRFNLHVYRHNNSWEYK